MNENCFDVLLIISDSIVRQTKNIFPLVAAMGVIDGCGVRWTQTQEPQLVG